MPNLVSPLWQYVIWAFWKSAQLQWNHVSALYMAKRQNGRSESGQSGLMVKWVTGQNWSFLNGLIGSRVESGWVNQYFTNNFFFLEIDVMYQLFMSSLTVIRFSVLILLPITTKHLTWYPNLVQLLFQLSKN